MKLLVLDSETTGFAHTDDVIEIAAALYHAGTKMILWQFSSLVPGRSYNKAEAINGIPSNALRMTDNFYDPYEEASHYADLADAVVAHNASFDRRMLGACWTSKTPWICSQHDLSFPKAGKCKKLSHLATDHGILVIGHHRALGDVHLLVALLRQIPNIEWQVKQAILKHQPAPIRKTS